jgi:hypothetical protein
MLIHIQTIFSNSKRKNLGIGIPISYQRKRNKIQSEMNYKIIPMIVKPLLSKIKV